MVDSKSFAKNLICALWLALVHAGNKNDRVILVP